MDGSVPKGVVIFVHGFGSSHKCWEFLLTLLSRDPRVTSQYDLEYIDYPTTWFSLNPFQRIPRLKELSEYLNSFVESPRFQGREITLVGHSQGGLLILTHLAQLLQAGKGEELSSLRQVILIATPNLGSTIASSFRPGCARQLPPCRSPIFIYCRFAMRLRSSTRSAPVAPR